MTHPDPPNPPPDVAEIHRLLRDLAASTRYPPTPNLAAAERLRLEREADRRPLLIRRRWAYALAVFALVLGSSLSVPSVRAAFQEVIQFGRYSLALGPSRSGPLLSAEGSVLDLAGEISLGEAYALRDLRVRLPAYPPDLGEPDRVYLQALDQGRALVLVWLVPGEQDRVRLSVHILEGELVIEKEGLERIESVKVNGQPAFWVSGRHRYQLADGSQQLERLVDGSVLLWEEAGRSYRLETDLDLDEAIQIAESLD